MGTRFEKVDVRGEPGYRRIICTEHEGDEACDHLHEAAKRNGSVEPSLEAKEARENACRGRCTHISCGVMRRAADALDAKDAEIARQDAKIIRMQENLVTARSDRDKAERLWQEAEREIERYDTEVKRAHKAALEYADAADAATQKCIEAEREIERLTGDRDKWKQYALDNSAEIERLKAQRDDVLRLCEDSDHGEPWSGSVIHTDAVRRILEGDNA